MIDEDALVDEQAIRHYVTDLGASTLRVWVGRGKLRRWGRDHAGRALYRWGDVAPLLAARRARIEQGLARSAAG